MPMPRRWQPALTRCARQSGTCSECLISLFCERHAVDEIARQAPVDRQDHLLRAGGHGNTHARGLVGQL